MGSIAKLPGEVLVPRDLLLPRLHFHQISFSRLNDDIANLGQA